MHQACAQHLDVDPHRIHLGDALAEVAHPAKHGLRPVLDLTAHLVGDAGIGRKLGEDVVLGRLRVDFGHDDVGVDIDCARVRLPRRIHFRSLILALGRVYLSIRSYRIMSRCGKKCGATAVPGRVIRAAQRRKRREVA